MSIYQVIIEKSPKELWDFLQQRKRLFEEIHAPAMLAGPFYECASIRCVVKYVPKESRQTIRNPDEVCIGMIEAVEMPKNQGAVVTFRLNTFPDHELFQQTVSELLQELLPHTNV